MKEVHEGGAMKRGAMKDLPSVKNRAVRILLERILVLKIHLLQCLIGEQYKLC